MAKHKRGCPPGGPFKKGSKKLRKGWRFPKRGGRPVRAKHCR